MLTGLESRARVGQGLGTSQLEIKVKVGLGAVIGSASLGVKPRKVKGLARSWD